MHCSHTMHSWARAHCVASKRQQSRGGNAQFVHFDYEPLDWSGIKFRFRRSEIRHTRAARQASIMEGAEDTKPAAADTITIRVKDQVRLLQGGQHCPTPCALTWHAAPQLGEEMFFKVKRTTKMSKVFDAYAGRKGVPSSTLRFFLDGDRINADDTPKLVRQRPPRRLAARQRTVLTAGRAQLDLQDADQIDCMLEQQGGRA